jgi:hypothetical protein
MIKGKSSNLMRVFAIFAAVAVLAAVLAAAAIRNNSGENAAPYTEGETVTVEGEYQCLPKKGDGPQTLECAFGLRVDDDTHYALDMTDLHNRPDNDFNANYTIGDRLRVTGVFEEPKPDTTYDIRGTIYVESIEPL